MDLEFDFSLSFKEFYFMAIHMNFEYMDYSYFADLNGVQKNFELFKENCAWSLDERGLAEVDYDGNVIWIDENLEAALEPVFYGKQECAVIIGEDSFKIHIDGDKMTLIKAESEIMIKTIDISVLAELLRGKTFEIRSSHIDKGIYKEQFVDEELEADKLAAGLYNILSGNCYMARRNDK